MAAPATSFALNKDGSTGMYVDIPNLATGEFEETAISFLVAASEELSFYSDATTAPASVSGGIAYSYAVVLFTIVTSAVKDVIMRGVVVRAR